MTEALSREDRKKQAVPSLAKSSKTRSNPSNLAISKTGSNSSNLAKQKERHVKDKQVHQYPFMIEIMMQNGATVSLHLL